MGEHVVGPAAFQNIEEIVLGAGGNELAPLQLLQHPVAVFAEDLQVDDVVHGALLSAGAQS